MRTRFRAWHLEKGIMYKVALLDFYENVVGLDRFMADTTDYTEEDLLVRMEEVSIMQESGMTDDMDMNIFEGDIIKFADEYYRIAYGDYGDSDTGINGYGWHMAGKIVTFPYVGGGEKVGNIFENPQLITG